MTKEQFEMIYKDFKNIKLSALALGAMRLPIIDGNLSRIDEDRSAEMVDLAMAQGLNYFDTAWGYHNGQSEVVLGRLLSKYPRESYCLANKFPGYDLSNMDKVEAIFEQQLNRCGVTYFDFYLIHNVCELNINDYLDEKHGILAYLLKQKKNGRIRHLGFSAHGSLSVIKRFLAVYGDNMEFCQIQLNYIDWSFQDAKAKVDLLNEHNIPVWVMEPLRGGLLATLAEGHLNKLKALRPNETPVAWAYRFLQSIPGIAVTLTGASDIEQLRENITIFSEEKPLAQYEMDTLLGIADSMVKSTVIPCTACNYCVSHCTSELNIPSLLSMYNEHHFTGGGFIVPMAMATIPKEKRPSACTGCRACEAVCPQQIKVSEAMADLTAMLKN